MSAPIAATELELARVSLPSGRELLVRGGSEESIEVRSPDGLVELSVVLTPEGPVLRFSGARVELSAGTLALHADNIEIGARELASVTSGGEVVVQAPLIKLN